MEDVEGYTLLARILEFAQYDLSSKLLARGLNINAQNQQGLTALSLLLRDKRVPQSKFLLVNGANPHLEDERYLDSCDYARINDLQTLSQIYGCNQPYKRRRFDGSISLKDSLAKEVNLQLPMILAQRQQISLDPPELNLSDALEAQKIELRAKQN